MSNVLGLSFFFHDSAAALVSDGRIVAAALEERFCRRKHTNEFPKQAIEYCLEAGGFKTINQVDAIVFYEKPILKLQRIIETSVAVWPLGLANFVRRLPPYLSSKFNVYYVIGKALPGYQGPILFVEHHLSHAASAFYCSPFDEAAILTIDGVGEWETTTIGTGKGREIRLDRAIHFPHSIGLLYSALTSFLGFQVNDGEWKVMGLAPYGEPTYVDQFRRLVQMKPDGSFRLNMEYFGYHYSSQWAANNARWETLFGFPRRDPNSDLEQHHENLARSGQVVVEDMILNLAREASRYSGSENLVIAGGVGLNSVANWKIEREGIFKNVWVQPAAGDDGGALGAALLASQTLLDDPPCDGMRHVYLGPEVSDDDAGGFLQPRGIAHERLEDEPLIERVADLIAHGKVVGWCRGRMEFGPRSLGARSILADATNPEMKAIVNRKIKYREYFRPFAPAVPLERVHEYFDVPPGTSLPFMLKVPAVRPEKRTVIPAVTHEDGTGRVQTVTKECNPIFHRLLESVGRRTGAPVVLNTSFNVRGEPIVCTPEDAYNCFLNTGIDALVIGNRLVTEKPTEVDFQLGYARSDVLEAENAAASDERGRSSRRLSIQSLTNRDTSLASRLAGSGFEETTQKVLNFYKELPFNYYSNAVDTAQQLSRANRIKEYRSLHRYLRDRPGGRVIDVGCGAGWFVNSCAHFYEAKVVGMDLNPHVLKQARSVARLMRDCDDVQFIHANVFEFQPDQPFDVVNSLGVLHHTPDCHAAIRRVLDWVAPAGYLHLGLYHLYGRTPFLEHFAKLRADGASQDHLYEEFRQLNPNITDETHMLSWFRDQVLHPHESQHTFEEIQQLLAAEGFVVEATSINKFKRLPSVEKIIELERAFTAASEAALYRKRRYYPGFFVVWARRG
jgi:carbamoyltransferase